VQYFINTSIASTVSDDYSCEVDVTCLVKKQCNGLHECSITVDDNLFSGDLCSGLSNYLYFEYQCIDTVKPFNELCGTHGCTIIMVLLMVTCSINQHWLCTRQICLQMRNSDFTYACSHISETSIQPCIAK
jgi:hypothetical protein